MADGAVSNTQKKKSAPPPAPRAKKSNVTPSSNINPIVRNILLVTGILLILGLITGLIVTLNRKKNKEKSDQTPPTETPKQPTTPAAPTPAQPTQPSTPPTQPAPIITPSPAPLPPVDNSVKELNTLRELNESLLADLKKVYLQPWQIVSAKYGTEEKFIDVLTLIRTAEKSGGLLEPITVNNDTMGGDPEPNKEKALRIDFVIPEGKTLRVIVKEKNKIGYSLGSDGILNAEYSRWDPKDSRQELAIKNDTLVQLLKVKKDLFAKTPALLSAKVVYKESGKQTVEQDVSSSLTALLKADKTLYEFDTSFGSLNGFGSDKILLEMKILEGNQVLTLTLNNNTSKSQIEMF